MGFADSWRLEQTLFAEGVYAFRTVFHPLAFGLANKESQATYQILFESVCACALSFAGLDLREACHQYHADMHMGEDLAQKSIFAKALRVADWARVIGACTRPKHSKVPASAGEKLEAFRSGVFATLKSNLSPAGQKLLPLVRRVFFCLRSLPTALVCMELPSLSWRRFAPSNPPKKRPPRPSNVMTLFHWTHDRLLPCLGC